MTMRPEKNNAYEKLEQLVMNQVCALEAENAQLKSDLAIAQAKLEIYERIATVSDPQRTIGFGPPISKEGQN